MRRAKLEMKAGLILGFLISLCPPLGFLFLLSLARNGTDGLDNLRDVASFFDYIAKGFR